MSGFIIAKMRRKLAEFLSTMPQENISYCITHRKWLTDYIPSQKKLEWKRMTVPYYELIKRLTPEQAYDWVPPQHRDFIESIPGGREWALGQLQYIKDFLLST